MGAGAYLSWRVYPGQVASPSQGHTETNKPCTLTVTPRVNLKSLINLTSMFLGLWEEAGVPGENPRIDGESMQTPHRKTPTGILTRNPLAVR